MCDCVKCQDKETRPRHEMCKTATTFKIITQAEKCFYLVVKMWCKETSLLLRSINPLSLFNEFNVTESRE